LNRAARIGILRPTDGDAGMSDLLIPDLDPTMRHALERLARVHDRDVVEEARMVLRNGLGVREDGTEVESGPPPGVGLGTWLFSLTPPEYRVDLDFEYPDVPSDPPDFS
jgi:hypothetical protein